MNPFESISERDGVEIRMIRSFESLHAFFMSLRNQKSETCGPYSLLKISNAMAGSPGEGLSEVEIAQRCGTVISPDEDELSVRLKGSNEDELDEQTREKYYPLKLAVSADEAEQGTSAEGVLRAAPGVLGSWSSIIPVKATSNGRENLTADRFGRITESLWKLLQEVDLHVILNIQVDLLCSNEGIEDDSMAMELISAGGCTSLDNWKVGHFVVLAGMLRYTGNGRDSYFYILQDNYKERGRSGYLLQPAEQLRKSMVRNDGKQGGIMIIGPEKEEQRLKNILPDGVEIGIWDNGTPFR